MDPKARILIVDDDHDIRTLLAEHLQTYDFAVSSAEDGRAMRRALGREKIDLVVLDLNLPGEDGLKLCRDLRAKSQLPVIMLTARGEPIDRILGLEMGADDYMAKPFEPRELVARIRNVLRRAQGLDTGDDVAGAGVVALVFAGRRLDLQRRHLVNTHGQVMMLSGAEFRVLKAFTEHPNKVLGEDGRGFAALHARHRRRRRCRAWTDHRQDAGRAGRSASRPLQSTRRRLAGQRKVRSGAGPG